MPTLTVTPEKGKIPVGAFELPMDVIASLDAIDATGKAIRLHDGRVQFKAKVKGTDTPVTFTVALSVTRDPLSDVESVQVAAKAAEQKARKAQKASDEQAIRDREFERGAKLSQDAVMNTLSNADRLMGALRAIKP